MDNQSSSQFSPLQITFTGKRVGSLSGFVKLLASWLIFIGAVMLPVLGQAQTKGSSSGQQKDVIPFIDYQNLGNTQSRARTLASPANARVQGDFPDLCSGIYNLNFEDPKLVSGTDRQAGAVYTFQNVVTLPGNVIHARVTIESVVNGSVSLFDNVGDGFPSALQPSFLPEDNRASGQGFSISNS